METAKIESALPKISSTSASKWTLGGDDDDLVDEDALIEREQVSAQVVKPDLSREICLGIVF